MTCAAQVQLWREIVAGGANVESFEVGDRVVCGGEGYATHSEVNHAPANICVQLPSDVSTADAEYVRLSAIAIRGARRLDLTTVETDAVIGLGPSGI